MALSTTLRLVDQMTAPIMAIQHAISGLENRFNSIESAANIDTSSLTAMQNQIDMTDAAARVLADNMQLVVDNIQEMTQGQSTFSNEMVRSASAADGLVQKIGAAVAGYASIQGLNKVLGLSDDITQNAARLNLIVDDGGSVGALQDKIFLSAQRARADYQMTSDVISKLGMQAGNAFSSNDELIAFGELLNKTFKIAGTDASGIESTMYNLTQALSSGVLRGQDLNAVFSNAQPIIQNIADYLDIPAGQIRDMAADGELSASVVKNAMLAAAEATNKRFEEMPMTFADAATDIKNQALKQFEPILNRLNEFANSPAYQTMANNAVNTFIILSGVANATLDAIAAGGQFVSDNWSLIAPVIGGVAAALLLYNGYMLISNVVTGIANGLAAISAARSALKAGATLAEAAATTTATGAQVGLNAALLACPLTWIIISIIALIAIIYLVVAAVNKFAGTTISATGVIFGAFTVLGAAIWNIIVGVINAIIQFLWTCFVAPWISVIEFIINVANGGFNSFGDAVANLIGNIIGWFFSLGQVVTKIIDVIFGTNWTSGLEALKNNVISWGKNESAITITREAPTLSDLGINRWAYSDAWNVGYMAGENLENTISNFDPASLFPNNIPTESDYNAGMSDYPSIADGVDNIDANTSKQLDYSEEELKLWRDIAERDTINRFTTAEVTVTFGDINNNVSSELDLDGIVTYISEQVEETLFEVAEGVHQ